MLLQLETAGRRKRETCHNAPRYPPVNFIFFRISEIYIFRVLLSAVSAPYSRAPCTVPFFTQPLQ
jgi:hypothetical protein